jgi:hypothetical protein
MRPALSLAAFAACLASAGGALADEPPSARASAQTVLVPVGRVAGSTSGKGTVTAGADLSFGLPKAPSWDMAIVPSLTLGSSSGVASILSVKNDDAKGPASWSMGLTISFIGHDSSLDKARTVEERKMRSEAFGVCLDRCAMPSLEKDEQAFCDAVAAGTLAALMKWRPPATQKPEDRFKAREMLGGEVAKVQADVVKKLYAGCKVAGDACECPERREAEPVCKKAIALAAQRFVAKRASGCGTTADDVCTWLGQARFDRGPDSLAPDTGDFKTLCKAGNEHLKNAAGEPASSPYPLYVISIGGTYGANAFKYLDGKPGPTNPLTQATVTKSDFAIGGVFTWVEHRAFGNIRRTVEVPVVFQSKWSAADTTAKWCTTQGLVPRSGGSDAAQTCDEQPLGPPQHSSKLWTAVIVGGVYKSTFRASIGPTFSYDFAATTPSPWALGMEAPLSVALLDGLSGYKGSYKGVIRLVPAFAFVHKEDGVGVSAMVTASLLGERSLFGGVFDWP